jgi:predicted aminopeptidase
MQTISEIVLHEMVHETIYTRSKAEFNESSASFISEQANLMFIREKYSNESREYKEAVESYEIDKIWEKQLSDIRVSLEKIYSSRLTKMEKLEQKRTLLDGKFQELAMDDKFKHSLNKLGRDSWNNAYFAGFATYHYDTNVFHKMLEKCNNDLAKMIELLKRICSKGDPFALMNKYINGEDISLPMIKSKIRRR